MVVINWLEALGILATSLTAIGTFCYLSYRFVLKPIHIRLVVASDIIERELTPNHGSSLYDAITRVEGKLDAHLQVALEETAQLNKLTTEYEQMMKDDKL